MAASILLCSIISHSDFLSRNEKCHPCKAVTDEDAFSRRFIRMAPRTEKLHTHFDGNIAPSIGDHRCNLF